MRSGKESDEEVRLAHCESKAIACRESARRTRLALVISISVTLLVAAMKLLPEWAGGELGIAVFMGITFIASLFVLEIYSKVQARERRDIGDDTGGWAV